MSFSAEQSHLSAQEEFIPRAGVIQELGTNSVKENKTYLNLPLRSCFSDSCSTPAFWDLPCLRLTPTPGPGSPTPRGRRQPLGGAFLCCHSPLTFRFPSGPPLGSSVPRWVPASAALGTGGRLAFSSSRKRPVSAGHLSLELLYRLR